jgi:hypothetical protein
MYIECVALSLTLALTPTVLARSYTLENSFIGRGFLEGFGWENFDDPTHGRVDYVDQQTALVTNLSFGVSVVHGVSKNQPNLYC